MRRCIFLIALFLLALTQYMAVAEDLPEFRPALIGKAPDAIINRIDAKMLSAAGQKDAVVMFFAAIDQTGEV